MLVGERKEVRGIADAQRSLAPQSVESSPFATLSPMSESEQDGLPVEGPWDLAVAGFEVIHMTLSFHVDITAYGESAKPPAKGVVGAPSAMLRLAGSFSLREPDGHELALDPSQQDWDDLRPLFALRGDRIASARASKCGQLRV